jgi:hypothetical protein
LRRWRNICSEGGGHANNNFDGLAGNLGESLDDAAANPGEVALKNVDEATLNTAGEVFGSLLDGL